MTISDPQRGSNKQEELLRILQEAVAMAPPRSITSRADGKDKTMKTNTAGIPQLETNTAGVPQPRDLQRPRPIHDDQDRAPQPYAPPEQRPQPFPVIPLARDVAVLNDLERTIADPEHGVAVGVTDLKYHQAISVAAGIIAKGEKLKDIAPHELAAAMNAWGLEKRTPPQGE